MGGEASKEGEHRGFVGVMATARAESLLMGPEANPGDFLGTAQPPQRSPTRPPVPLMPPPGVAVRESISMECHMLSVRANRQRVDHFPLLCDKKGSWHIADRLRAAPSTTPSEATQLRFPSLLTLVRALVQGGKAARIGFEHLGCFLIRPLDYEAPPETMMAGADVCPPPSPAEGADVLTAQGTKDGSATAREASPPPPPRTRSPEMSKRCPPPVLRPRRQSWRCSFPPARGAEIRTGGGWERLGLQPWLAGRAASRGATAPPPQTRHRLSGRGR